MAVSALLLLLVLVASGVALQSQYRFSRTLDTSGQYLLYWSFDDDTISFAVNVETTGWVGFGLSPNGQMPQSDVVIGWVDDTGEVHFHVSHAIHI